MAHQNQQQFFEKVKEKFPDYFKGKKVIEGGSLNVNGSFRPLFEDCEYTGVDIVSGPDVDVVSKMHELTYPDKSFDVVVSGEMLEHDEYWRQSLQKMYDLLKDGGLITISCAGEGRREHGTSRTGGSVWGTAPDYYRNLTPANFKEVYKPEMFKEGVYEVNTETCDTYFYGIK